MYYIILWDSQGKGLETIESCELDIIDEKDLKDYIIGAACTIWRCDDFSDEEITEEDVNFFSENIVILSVLDKFNRKPVDKFVASVLKDELKIKKDEEYKKYLELKERFEKPMSKKPTNSKKGKA